MRNYGNFYAVMPDDNPAAIPAGSAIDFPETSAASAGITRSGTGEFTLAEDGVYLVTFQASTADAGQLVLTLNGAELPYTVVGRTADGAQIVGTAIVDTAVPNATLSVNNPTAAAGPLTLTSSAGGADPVSANLTIVQLQ